MNFKEAITEIIYKNSKDTVGGVLIDFKNIHNLIDKIDEAFSLYGVVGQSEQLPNECQDPLNGMGGCVMEGSCKKCNK